MAIILVLTLHFDRDQPAAAAAAEELRSAGHVLVRGRPEPLQIHLRHEPYVELSVMPRGMTTNDEPQASFDLRSLTGDEVSGVAAQLYALLRRLSGYRAAIVDRNGEDLVNLYDLEAEVLCTRWHLDWPPSPPATAGAPGPPGPTPSADQPSPRCPAHMAAARVAAASTSATSSGSSGTVNDV